MKIYQFYLRYMFVLCSLMMSFATLSSQNDSISTLQKLDKLLSKEDFSQASTVLHKTMDSLLINEQFYELSDYVYYLGKITSKLENNSRAEEVIQNLKTKVESLTKNSKALRQLHLEIGSFYESIGNTDVAIQNNLKAYEYTKIMPNASGQLFGLIESNLGVFYSRTGHLEKAIDYHSKATASYLSDKTTPKESFYMNYNSLGAMMWYQSKMDSALIYFRKAEKTLKTMDATPWNQFYRSASLQNNISGVYSILGNQKAALQEMQKCVDNLKTFLKQEGAKDLKKNHAREFLYQAMDNYARLHKEIGNYTKAKQIIEYAFLLKKTHLNPESPEISKSKVLIGQAEVALHNFNEANTILDESIYEFENYESTYNNWLGMAYYYKGQANDYLGNTRVTETCYEKSNTYFKKSLGIYYDEIYLDFVINASAFYTRQKDSTKALNMAHEAYDYIIENQGKKTILEYFQVLNIAQIELDLNRHHKALDYSNRALNILKDSAFVNNNDIGKLRINVLKPDAILVKVKAEYALKHVKDENFLKSKLKDLQHAISILEEQKSIISDDNTLSVLLINNNEIFEWAKKIALELYFETDSSVYLKQILNLHESMLYNRIRKRLNSRSEIEFADIPEDILEKENELKNKLKTSISINDQLDSFITADQEWSDFLKKLKVEFPNYYNLKYASISKSMDNIQNSISEDRTVIRYAFINSDLFAFVICQKQVKLIKLDANKVKENISKLRQDTFSSDHNFDILHELYNDLWRPLASSINTVNVTIIPDQILFNLNFEMLTPERISSYQEMLEGSLLANHTISYNYSLFLTNKSSKTLGYDNNFIAFAPEFNSKMKSDYQLSVSDSLGLDNAYLKLLPQPFTKNLAKSSSKLFDGTSFLNEKASKQLFTSSAKEHKIIHIGTHAESNNISPELSRLIFAKNISDSTSTDDNSLYTFEIYNQNLSSNLAILTACETGKPTYQAGEGMISLAHAFNYAGSESILTSLWKIDEKSSAKIIELFYKNISKGMTKDKALKHAKLDYIKTAEGRTKHPDYWAGLVLIGDTSPIELNSPSSLIYWLLFIVGIVILYVIIKRK